MTSDKREFYFKSGATAYRGANKEHWRFAFFAAKVVGAYQMDGTISMAKDMSVERSTVENHAHAWQMFYDLVCLDEAASRFVRTVRTVPFIYYTHFRTLWEVRNSYRLSNEQCLDLLQTLWQGEGEFSAGDIERLARERFGDTRDWTYYAQKAQKNLSELLKQPDLPSIAVKNTFLFNVVADISDGSKINGYVIAPDSVMATRMFRKSLEATDKPNQDSALSVNSITAKNLGTVSIESKQLLQQTYSWIGDHS